MNAVDAQSSYTYDSASRFHTVTDGTDTFIYGYLDQAPNTLETITGPVHTVHLEYEDGRNAMTKVTNTETVGAQNLVSEYVYTYNKLGQRAYRIQRGAGLITSKDTFSYDGLGQVTGSSNDVNTALAAWNPSYAYDMIGSRVDATVPGALTQVNYTANLLNQYEQITTATPLYDLDSNMTSKGLWSYTWNGENRLIQATDGADTLIFEYDFQGRLISQTVNSGTAQHYLYDGWNRIASYTGLALNQSYLWGLDLSGSPQGAGGVGGLLREGTMYPLYDANGNITQKLDALGGEIMNVSYDPFGNIIVGSMVGEYGFSTKPLIESLGFYYYVFRYYDPETGRWPNRDPIEEQGGYNLYGFVGNDGVNAWDVKGLWKGDEHKMITENAFSIAIDYSILPVSGGARATIVKLIVQGNIMQDESMRFFEGPRHYSVRLDSKRNIPLTDWRRRNAAMKYKEYLRKEEDDFNNLISKPNKYTCEKALLSLGLMSHSWQDFYSHGIRKDGGGSTTPTGGSSASAFPGWIAFSEGVKSSPDDTVSDSRLTPCTYNWWSFFGGTSRDLEHPSDGEPITGAERFARERAATDYTSRRYPSLIKSWVSACGCNVEKL